MAVVCSCTTSQIGEVSYYCGIVCDLLNSWEILHKMLLAVATAPYESFDPVAARAKAQRILSQRLPKALQQLRNEIENVPSNTSILRKQKAMCLLECFYLDAWRAFAEQHHRGLRLDAVGATPRGRRVADKLAMVIEDSFAFENSRDGDYDPLLNVLIGNLKLRISEVSDAIYAPTLDEVCDDEALRNEGDFVCAAALSFARSIGEKCGVTMRIESVSVSSPQSCAVPTLEVQPTPQTENDNEKRKAETLHNRGSTCGIM